jgi:phosphotransferase system, enzyme I, PtsP
MSEPEKNSLSLLHHLRKVAASPLYGRERLDMIVRLIADSMTADVCSIYILRTDNFLELYATEGLNRTAIHRTILKVGEGIIGWCADDQQSIAIADARKHERFAYRPETDEDSFHSMMCVPLLKNHKTVGVLALQNSMRRQYTQNEIELMEIIAMVVTEMLDGASELNHLNNNTPKIKNFSGVSLYEGMVSGHIYLHEPYVRITQFIADDIEVEHLRLRQAMETLKEQVDHLIRDAITGLHSETKEILETYRIFSQDKGWFRRISEAIEQGLTAEAAVDHVRTEIVHKMQSMNDNYLRERYHDFEDLANRLLRLLSGKPLHKSEDMPENTIIIAKYMGPAELLEYNLKLIKGLIIEEASQTSHVSILARSLGIPSIGRCKGIYQTAKNYYPILLDAHYGKVLLDPDKVTLDNFNQAIKHYHVNSQTFDDDKPLFTADNVAIKLFANAGLSYDLNHIKHKNPDGIGLFRTELQLLMSAGTVTQQEQTSFYKSAFDIMHDKPIYFRTFDIGGDKIPTYLNHTTKEDNPAMGFRGIRIGIDRPSILRLQMRSFLNAAQTHPLNILFPMITTLQEFITAKNICLIEYQRFQKLGLKASQKIRFGMMIETPIVAFQIEQFIDDCDFFSVGGNDLLQFSFAADRDNPQTASRYDRLSTNSLKLFHSIIEKTKHSNIPVCFCGEMASNSVEIAALIAIGYRSFSLSVTQISVIKQMLRKLDINVLQKIVMPYLDFKNIPTESLREALRDYIYGHIINSNIQI